MKIFSKILKTIKTLPILTDILRQYRGRIFIGTLLILISRIGGLVLPASTKLLGDEIITKQNYSYLKWIALAVACSTIVEAVTRFLISQILGRVAQNAVAELRKNLQKKVLYLPVSFFNSMTSGQLLSRIINDAESIRILVSTGIGNVLGSILTMLVAVSVLFYLNFFLTVMILFILIILGLFVFLSLKKVRPIFRERSKLLGQIFGRLGETINGIRIIKAYTAEKREEKAFAMEVENLQNNNSKSLFETSKISAITTLVTGFIGILIILIGGTSVQNGTMTLGDFLMYVSFTFLLALPIAELTMLFTQITDSLANLERIHEILHIQSENENEFLKENLPEIIGNIDFENVYCRYENEIKVLKDITFHVPAGTTTALVGSSGSGKTTILNLLLNFIKPEKGLIKIDGKDIQSFKLSEYRRNFGVVLQDNFLFDGTILENISFSKPNATLAEIKYVCELANADEFIEKLPHGYETIVGERGIKLSIGQRQRIAIARALLVNPKILVLDEATSSLDSESEALIQKGLDQLRQGRTVFVVAHRLSTIRSADQIIVIESGNVIEQGTHGELHNLNGRYKQLYDKQYKFS